MNVLSYLEDIGYLDISIIIIHPSLVYTYPGHSCGEPGYPMNMKHEHKTRQKTVTAQSF